MKKWEQFEINCTNHLNSKYSNCATFIHNGGSDSTIPDILVKKHNGETFYIEAKQCPAQCGQFVLLPDIANNTFIYSNLNSTPLNTYSNQIILHMNNYFDEFKEAGTSGKDIVISNADKIFSKWIIDMYQSKNVKYFITNNYLIIPIDEFGDNFNITATYRIKRSGSSDVGKNNITLVKNFLANSKYSISNFYTKDKKLFITSNTNLHNKRFYLNNYEYMISDRGEQYEVRKLSNTFNANVIFSIDLKKAMIF